MANLSRTWTIKCLAMAMLAGALLAGCATKPVYSINCGADEIYVDAAGKTWLADQEKSDKLDWGVVGGEVVLRDIVEIPGTQAPMVYLNECYSMAGYVFKLAPGKYTVRLHFAETFEGITAEGERVFDVSINEKVVLKDFDVFKEAGGAFKPVIKEIKGVEVADKLAIDFTTNVQNPEINGIEILAE
ncbi:MAG: malectin domain-containing carbohydrate-binding protein [Phycisphaerae bacterium]|nr:malectin domain-containing carbohydrate-binding protein [Phycisphaerae bacterium]